jgi:lactam utilization protein B
VSLPTIGREKFWRLCSHFGRRSIRCVLAPVVESALYQLTGLLTLGHGEV